MREENILKSFFIRSLLAMFLTTLITSFGIYYYQNTIFTNSLEKNISEHIDEDLHKYTNDLKDVDKAILKEDVKHFMQTLNFISIEIYDKTREEVFELDAKGKSYQETLQLLTNHDEYLIHNFPDSKKMNSNFFELPNEHYFIQIFYPLYKNGSKIGYIEGISLLDPIMVNRFKRGIVVTIVTVCITVLILGIILFPIIYFAYKRLNANRIELLSSNIMTLNTLGNAIALRDSDTNEHNYRVTIYAIKLAQKLKISNEDIKKLIKGAFLHDVGKIGISDNVLLKNGKLTDDEFTIMKKHVEKGVSLIKDDPWLEDSKDVILCHHEKYDGSGYPNALRKDQIPLIAKIFSIVDVFDALTSKRPYKEPFSFEKSMDIITEGSGKHFDPVLVGNFLKISKNLYDEIRLKDQHALKAELDNLVQEYFLT